MHARLSLLVIIIMLAACGGGPPALPAGAGSQATVESVRGEDLPGRLIFVQQGTIWLWQGREARPLFGAGVAWQPAWSPDGTRIAYIERGVSYSDVMLADGAGQHLAQLTFNGSDKPIDTIERIYESSWAFYPAWSPASGDLTVAAQEAPPAGSPAAEYNLALYTLAPGGERRLLHAEPEAHCGRLAYAPDGATFVYTRTGSGPGGVQQLYQLDLASGVGAPVPGAPERSYDPAFSPDGAWLAFTARDGERTDIWALPAGGAPAPLRLTDLGMARAPAFSPDGSRLAFLAIAEGKRGFDLWIADVRLDDGTIRLDRPRQLTFAMGLDADSGLSWAP